MLFGYPLEATVENWLHDCLLAMLQAIHTYVDEGEDPPGWPAILPDACRSALKDKTGLRDRLDYYKESYRGFTETERDQVKACLVQQNRIGELCECAENCEPLSALQHSIQKPIADLFEFAFGLLTPLRIRDWQYETIYGRMTYRICPFCGCENLDAPGAAREDLDHYLPKSRYPFAAANLHNLVPMGSKCNRLYKRDQDILIDENGVRRRAFYPYADHHIRICLDESIPFAGADGVTPAWKVSFIPDLPECETWDQVFRVRERLARDVLDAEFRRWLREFAAWYRMHAHGEDTNVATIMDQLSTYAEDNAIQGLSAKEFLRVPVFRMIHHHCASGNKELVAVMVDLVAGV